MHRTHAHAHTRRATALAAVLALAVAVVGCSSGGSDGAASDASSTTTTAATAPLQILVSNDDGYQAEGIDQLVEGLGTLDGVEVTVVAPLEQRSLTGGKTTDGPLATQDVSLASGHPATAVDGYPADAIRVAMDDVGIQPDLVVTGINQGQNLGPAVDLSGTVGAARAAVARGVPALATSQGLAAELDYDVAVPLILDWVTQHRAALADGSAPVEVASLNIPSCDQGELRGLVEVPAETDGDLASTLAPADCTSTTPEADLTGDVAAFQDGFATLSTLAAKPAA